MKAKKLHSGVPIWLTQLIHEQSHITDITSFCFDLLFSLTIFPMDFSVNEKVYFFQSIT